MRYVTRPLTDAARARLALDKRPRVRSQFDTLWRRTLHGVERELEHLGVRYEWVLQIDVQESDLRLDGELRANARPASPDVAIAIDSPTKGDLLFTCGHFLDWQDNVRALALSLESLRRVERYGVVQSNEQYRGWQAIGSGTPMPAAAMTETEALHELGLDRGATAAEAHESWRQLAKVHHPDRGGDPAAFRRISEARDLLTGGRA